MRAPRCSSLVLGLIGVSAACAQDAAPAALVHAGTLLADPLQPVRSHQTVIVREGRISAIRDGFLSAAQAGLAPPYVTIDLSGSFVLPGMIDLHVHLTSEAEAGEAQRVVTRGPAELALVARAHARETLEAGFTTVLDLGTGRRAHGEAIRALRAAIAAGTAAGPRLLIAGAPLSTTASSRTGRFTDEVEAAVGPEGVCDGAEDCARAVREQVASGADVINFYNSGSIGDLKFIEQAMTDEEMRAIVTTAHALGRKVVADGHAAAGINAALRAGADIIDTAPWPDETSYALMKERAVFFEPHMHAFKVAVGDARSGSTTVADVADSPILARLRSVLEQPFSAQRALERGVTLAYGSDTGIVRHGDNGGDLPELVKIGLTPLEAIAVATRDSARALGREAEIGSLAPGSYADLIAVHGDPRSDINLLRNVTFVMREGHVYKNQ